MTTARQRGLPHNQARLVFEREIVGHLARTLVDRLAAAHHPELRPPRSVRSTGAPPWRVRTTTGAELIRTVADLASAYDRLAIIAPLGHHDLYVAMTRATRQLGIVHAGAVPAELAGVRPRTPRRSRPGR